MDFNSTVFYVRGGDLRVRWIVQGFNASAEVDFALFFANGTLLTTRGSSGTFSDFADEIPIEEPGNYFINVYTNNAVDWYLVAIWDRY